MNKDKKNKKQKNKKTLMLAITIILLVVLITIIFVQKNKNNSQYEIDNIAKQEELVQKIQRKLTVLKVEGETIYGTIKFESTIENLEYVAAPNRNQIKLEKETKELAIDYELQNKQEYEFKVKAKGNEEEIIKIVVDKDKIPKIEIKQDNYAHITTSGVTLDRLITMDQTEGFKTLYSLDNGKTWQEYTGGEIKTNQLVNSIIGKKVPIDEEDVTITLEKYEKMPDLADDAIAIPSYDYNEETTSVITKDEYIKIEPEMEGFKIQVQSNSSNQIIFLKADKSTQISSVENNGGAIIIPKEARYLKVVKENPLKNIKEIKALSSVKFTVTYIGQTKITIKAEVANFSGEVTYKYYLNGTQKLETKQGTYQYTGLTPYVEYEIKVIAQDAKGNIDTQVQRIRTKSDNSSIIGNITSDEVDKSSAAYSKVVAGNTNTYEILYLDQSNIGNYGTYNASTNTYTITKNMNLGTANISGKMAVLKCDGNLTINSGVTITTSTYDYTIDSSYKNQTKSGKVTQVQGLFVCCMGTLTNNGTISQTGRGTLNAPIRNVYLWSNNGNYDGFYVPAYGGSGGSSVSGQNKSGAKNGNDGGNGSYRRTGGGGSGAFRDPAADNYGVTSGAGSSGSSYSGGSGGGGAYGSGTVTAQSGVLRKLSDGDGRGQSAAGGGAGNPGGLGYYQGETGTGGLLIVYANTLINNGTIEANGKNGGYGYRCSGGSSGGGSINLFYSTDNSKKGNAIANGGIQVQNGANAKHGGAGGNGSVSYDKIKLP